MKIDNSCYESLLLKATRCSRKWAASEISSRMIFQIGIWEKMTSTRGSDMDWESIITLCVKASELRRDVPLSNVMPVRKRDIGYDAPVVNRLITAASAARKRTGLRISKRVRRINHSRESLSAPASCWVPTLLLLWTAWDWLGRLSGHPCRADSAITKKVPCKSQAPERGESGTKTLVDELSLGPTQ